MLLRTALAVFAFVSAALATPRDADAAVATTCLCRTNDGKGFRDQVYRHHRWACDYALGYIKDPDNNNVKDPARLRPQNQTCNREEVLQYKVWICMQNGCTYAFIGGAKASTDLRKIEVLKGQRGR